MPDIVGTGVITRAEATKAWEEGLEAGRRWIICHPLSSVPVQFSGIQGPGLSAPPKVPFVEPDDPVQRALRGQP